MDPILILSISAYYHDSAACLLLEGDIVAAAQEGYKPPEWRVPCRSTGLSSGA